MTNTLNKIIHNGDEYELPRQKALVITLTSAGWNNNEQTVTATGVTANNSIIISPAPTDISDYTDAKIYCSAQGTNSLTFTCDTAPSNDIDVNILILSAEAGSTPTPPTPWQPGANTVAYYPLTTNGNDATSNHYDLTVGTGITFGANGAVFPSQAVGGLTGPNGLTVSSGSSFTISQWINLKKGTPGGTRVVEVYFDSSMQLANDAFYQGNSTLNHYIGNDWTPNSTFNENTWYNLIYTNNNNSVKVYLNGVQTDTGTFQSSLTSQGIIWGQNWGNNNGYAQGNMKDIIVEDKEWSAQDVADYFDLTKGDYGIS